MDSFVQNDGRWWGLQAVLGNLFPIFLKWGECWLDCAGFEVVGEPLSADECWRERGTRELRVRLRLRVCDWDDLLPLSEVNLETALPVPDERGWFWIDGEAYRYLPTVGADGRLLGRVSAPDWLDDQDEQEEVDAEEDSAEQDDASVEDERSTDTAEGAAIDALFSRAIERRLWYRIRSLRKSVQSNRWDEITADVVRAEWLAPLPPGEPYRLLSHGVFAVLLHPIDIERPAVELTDVVSEVGVCLKEPPSWACPDLSAQLMPGRWAAISSARLHPTGALAVPVSENGAVRLRATRRGAFHHNPRLGAVAPGPSTWWIHPLLISHAHLEPGVLQAPARVAGEGARLDLLAVAHPDAKAMLRPGCCSSTILRTKIDIPFNGRGAPPVILVAGGDELDEGRPWIQIPWELLGEDIEPSRLCERCEEVLGDDGRPGHLVYLPWDTRVRVQASGLSPVYRVGVQIGWRAFLEVETLTAAQPELLSEAGVLHSVHEWAPEDMPYDENGAIAEAVVPGVQGNDFWFDGATGQALQATTSGEITVVAPSVGSRDKGSPGAVDLLPRPGVLSCGEGWATTRLRILAGLAGPDWKERLLRAHQNHDLVRWCARVPGTTFSGLVEDVAKVPSITRPNSIPMLLSESGVDCLCTCGLLQGTAFLGARCNQCDSLVEVRSVEHTRRRVTLPVPAIHPWAKEIAGALLGLVPDELEVLLLEHGPTRVIRACHQVLHIPTVNASRRVALDNDHPRALRGQQRRRLGQVAGLLRPRTKEEMEKAIELHWVGVPTPDLVQPGVALDQLKPGGSDLLARFARLHGACWSVGVAADIGLEALEITAEVQLQQAVDQVFGAPHQGEVDTLAGLWRATSVWMRPDRPSVVPHYGDEAPFPSDAQWWSKRAARTELVEKYSVPLISLVSAVPGWPVSRCEEAVEQLARILLDDTSDLRSLLEIVARKLMVQLPSAHDEAEEGLRSRLGLSPNGAAGEALVRCLSGWWFGDSTAEVPSGMLWLPPDESPPSGYRRRVPPLDHSAWRDWSGRTALPDLGLALLGVPQVYDLPLALPIEQDPEIGEPDWGVRWEADEDLRSIPASPIELPRATPQREIEMEQDDIPTEEVEAGGVDEIVALDLTIAQWMERL